MFKKQVFNLYIYLFNLYWEINIIKRDALWQWIYGDCSQYIYVPFGENPLKLQMDVSWISGPEQSFYKSTSAI